MTDTEYELAEQHPELLTRECECEAGCQLCWSNIPGLDHPMPLVRRPLSLEEALEAIKDATRPTVSLSQREKDYAPIQRSVAFDYDWDATRVRIEVDAAGASEQGGAIIAADEGATEREAAYRLLIALHSTAPPS